MMQTMKTLKTMKPMRTRKERTTSKRTSMRTMKTTSTRLHRAIKLLIQLAAIRWQLGNSRSNQLTYQMRQRFSKINLAS